MEILNTETGATATVKSPQRLLVDSKPIRLQFVESADKPGKVIMRGEFARCGVATENKRVYPSKLWEREINRLGKMMENRRLFGELDHPSDGRTQLARASHIITRLEIKDGLVIGEAEILDTARGRDLKAIIQATGSCGISSRGYGSVRTNERGEDIVQEDYRLVTFDFVADPADQSAVPDVFYESKGTETMERNDTQMAEEFAKQLEAARKETREGVEAALKEEFAVELVTRLEALRAEVTEEVRGELLSDPAVAGARTALDKIKDVLRPYVLPADAQTVTEQKDSEIAGLNRTIAEQSLRIRELEGDLLQLESVAKEAGYKFHVERTIAGDPDAALIRKLVGDVTKYSNADELTQKVESVRADLEQKRAEAAALQEQLDSEKRAERERKDKERVRALKQEKTLREENEKLRLALEKATEANNLLGLKAYTESRIANHPRASKIRTLIESSNPQSRKEVDAIINEFREPARDSEALESVRARVRKATRGGFGPTPLEEEAPSREETGGGHYSQLGVSLSELRNLSGMSGTRSPSGRDR